MSFPFLLLSLTLCISPNYAKNIVGFIPDNPGALEHLIILSEKVESHLLDLRIPSPAFKGMRMLPCSISCILHAPHPCHYAAISGVIPYVSCTLKYSGELESDYNSEEVGEFGTNLDKFLDPVDEADFGDGDYKLNMLKVTLVNTTSGSGGKRQPTGSNLHFVVLPCFDVFILFLCLSFSLLC